MKFFFPLLTLLFPLFSIAQLPNLKEEADTLETITSDTTVIYVIQTEPVMIIEKVEVIKPKADYYLTVSPSVLFVHEFKKAIPPFEQYLSKVEAATNNTLSYSLGLSLWKCPKKIRTGYSVYFNRLSQIFEYTAPNGNYYKATNHFNYFNIGMQLGYWINKTNKERKISCQLIGSVHLCNLLSYSSATLRKEDSTITGVLRNEIAYREYTPEFSIRSTFLLTVRKQLMEISPFISSMPLSATKATEVYSIRRIMAGITIGITQRLF